MSVVLPFFRQVGAVLSGDPGDEGALGHALGLFDGRVGAVVELLGQADIQLAYPTHIMGGQLDPHGGIGMTEIRVS